MVIDRLAESHAIRVSRKENISYVGLGAIKRKEGGAGQAANVYEFEWPGGKGLLERSLTPGPLDRGLRRT